MRSQPFLIGAMMLLALLAAAQSPAARAAEPQPLPIGERVDDFQLADFRGKVWRLNDVADRSVVVVAFLGVECPLVQLYAGRLQSLADEYAERGVALVGINSNQHDSLAEIGHLVRTHRLTFPMLKDPGNALADRFGARRTPEVFVLDAQRRVRYHGRIDDQYLPGLQRPQVQHEYLKEAIDALLAGRAPETARTEVVGCLIGRVLPVEGESDVTYAHQISRILQRRCVECHRPGQIAPFSLTDYDEVVGWAGMIDEVVREQRMPPWHASAEHGQFANDARLSDEELSLIARWVRAGAPRGDLAQLPPPREFVDGWRIGQPDVIVEMPREYQVPATGEVKYQYFLVDPGFTEDKWIQAAECKPGNPAVVHHIIVAVAGSRVRNALEGHDDPNSVWLAATAPGARPMMLPPGLAKRVPAGSKLLFQMHYTPNGTPQVDRSSIGLKFADPATVEREVFTQQAANNRLAIPPGAENHRVESSYTFRQDGLLLAMFPHMHLRGKSFRYIAEYPSGGSEILLDVPRYDFNWQNSYELAEPKVMPKGTRLRAIAHFDNSERNLANPDPKATVRWGDQTWEEMMIGYFAMTTVDRRAAEAALRPRTEQFLAAHAEQAPPLDEQLGKLAAGARRSDDALRRFALALREQAPQLDRLCVVTFDGTQAHVLHAIQEAELDQRIGRAGSTLPAIQWRLAEVAAGEQTVTIDDTAAVDTPEFRWMSRQLKSSLHVPVRIGGKPATVNFWSAEPDAFPPTLRPLLEAAARRLAGS